MAGFAHDREQNAFGGAALMRRDHMPKTGQVVHHALQTIKALAAGVGLVAAHDGGPLFGGHGAGTGIRKEVDEDVAGIDAKQIVAGLGQVLFPLGGGGLSERLDAFYAERLNDGPHARDYRFFARTIAESFTNSLPLPYEIRFGVYSARSYGVKGFSIVYIKIIVL